jgi:hypothetical protein
MRITYGDQEKRSRLLNSSGQWIIEIFFLAMFIILNVIMNGEIVRLDGPFRITLFYGVNIFFFQFGNEGKVHNP